MKRLLGTAVRGMANAKKAKAPAKGAMGGARKGGLFGGGMGAAKANPKAKANAFGRAPKPMTNPGSARMAGAMKGMMGRGKK